MQIIHFHGQFQPYGKINNVTLAKPFLWKEEEDSAICFHVHLPQEDSAICSHVCHPSWPFIHGSVPWDLLNGKEKAGVVGGIRGCGAVSLLTYFVKPSLLLANAQINCFTLGQRSLWCHRIPSECDGAVLVMWPLGVDIFSWVTNEDKVKFPHKTSLICILLYH